MSSFRHVTRVARGAGLALLLLGSVVVRAAPDGAEVEQRRLESIALLEELVRSDRVSRGSAQWAEMMKRLADLQEAQADWLEANGDHVGAAGWRAKSTRLRETYPATPAASAPPPTRGVAPTVPPTTPTAAVPAEARRAAVEAALAARAEDVRRCYEPARRGAGAVAGSVVISLRVEPEGYVGTVSVNHPLLASPEAESCASGLLQAGLGFPPADAPIELVYPVELRPGP